MSLYKNLSTKDILSIRETLDKRYSEIKSKNLRLDMSRGKPGPDQLELSAKVLDCVNSSFFTSEDGTDCRNYGVFDGITESKRFFAGYFGADIKDIVVCGNSSLNLMYDYISQAMTHGCGDKPWFFSEKVKFICPVPGYDRHFSILERFNIEMINVDMLEDGPDMDKVEELIKDEAVKGFICVPKYSNPEGKTYSDEVVIRLAKMKPAAKDFRIIWDNAYAVHDLSEKSDKLLNLLSEAAKYGNEDMVVMFGSTSKITFPGAGISALAASENNLKAIKKRISLQTIGYDKLNQLRHASSFPTFESMVDHMKRHAEILRPKFEATLNCLETELGGAGVANWITPNGGYFISLNVMDGCAKRVVELCKNAGVVLTSAGATYPYKNDPRDRNIRIAPTYPPVTELVQAMELLCVCVKLAAIEKILAD